MHYTNNQTPTNEEILRAVENVHNIRESCLKSGNFGKAILESCESNKYASVRIVCGNRVVDDLNGNFGDDDREACVRALTDVLGTAIKFGWIDTNFKIHRVVADAISLWLRCLTVVEEPAIDGSHKST